ncbi:RecQ family ATP-dependent DNA helicase [Salimicrobium album]|uniref:ATP-dependent DNA helicase RecQ n=1 Tax=Salimicrobium album TaxID=50717 RepID=A0A1H3DXM4_9BACI|nr:ATP-dependent DNA helicase RecQ [Salimicrobium album]SDX71223.1 ATP-dependent DNA helicase RecQ [Salimicrobium album]
MEPINVKKVLEDQFKFSEFRPGQENVIENALRGVDTLAILPTGSGKSLCYQLPSLILPGLTIVVSPLISLMIDQVKQVKAKGMKRVAALHSFLSPQQKRKISGNLRKLDLIYISPEMLQMPKMKSLLKRETISLFVVDEAHCISQWGHEFRTDYLKLHQVISDLGEPPVLALSATATPEVQEDILFQLGRTGACKLIYPMDKPNIQLGVAEIENEQEKRRFLIDFLSRQKAPAMIYFSSRQMAEKVSLELKANSLGRIAYYHGGMDPVDRQLVQQQFMNNELDIVCCTSAFGMGIDKSDIRIVIHYHLPPRIESFIQEIGRAGRDGGECTSLLLYAPGDERLPQMFIQSELPSHEQIDAFLRFCYANEKTPSYEDCMHLELSESQYNFLIANAGDKDFSLQATARETADKLKERQLLRTEQKQNHLIHMMEVINTPGCRRKDLYRHFQEGFQTPHQKCCDHCHPEIFQVTYESVKERQGLPLWEERLYNIFHARSSYGQ